MKTNGLSILIGVLFILVLSVEFVHADHGGPDHHRSVLDDGYQLRLDRDRMQLRMNQQYQNQQLQNAIQRQSNEMYYQQQREQMRDQGWGRPGLDGVTR